MSKIQHDGGFTRGVTSRKTPVSARDAQRFIPRFPVHAGAESSQSQRPLVWAFSSWMSPAFIFDKCSEDTKFIACLHKENFFSLLKRKLPEQTPPRTRSSQPRLFFISPEPGYSWHRTVALLKLHTINSPRSFKEGGGYNAQGLPLRPTQIFLL